MRFRRLLLDTRDLVDLFGGSESTYRHHFRVAALPSHKCGRRRVARVEDVAAFFGVTVEEIHARVTKAAA